jgi:hypothetical protein
MSTSAFATINYPPDNGQIAVRNDSGQDFSQIEIDLRDIGISVLPNSVDLFRSSVDNLNAQITAALSGWKLTLVTATVVVSGGSLRFSLGLNYVANVKIVA